MRDPERLPIEWPEPTLTLTGQETTPPEPAPRRQSGWIIPMAAGFLGAGVAITTVLVTGIGQSTEPPVERVTEIVRTEIATPEAVTTNSLAAAVARRVVPSVVTGPP